MRSGEGRFDTLEKDTMGVASGVCIIHVDVSWIGVHIGKSFLILKACPVSSSRKTVH